MENPKIAICIPTFQNDESLMNTIRSILEIYQDNWVILIADLNPIDTYSFEKLLFYGTAGAKAHEFFPSRDRIKICQLPKKSTRIESLQTLLINASKLNIDYCLVMNDKTTFTDSFKQLNEVLAYMKHYDLIGFDIKGKEREVGTLQKSSDGILYTKLNFNCNKCNPDKMVIWNCNVVDEFYIAKRQTLQESLISDNNLEFFKFYNLNKHKVGWTDRLKGIYNE